MNRTLRNWALTLILASVWASASAQLVHNCSFTGQAGAQPSNCLGPDNSALGASDVQNMLFSQPNAISSNLAARLAGSGDGGPFTLKYPGTTGLAAGAMARTSNVWVAYGNVRAANSQAGSNFGATINNTTVGYDYAWSQDLVLGLSMASSDSGANTYFNNGRFDTRGYVAAPYLGYALNQHWAIDASAGWGHGNQTTTAFGSNAGGGVGRSFGAANLNGAYWFGQSQLATRLSVLSGTEKINSYTLGGVFVPQVGNSLTQAAAMARYGYWFEGFVPYASLTLVSDIDRPANSVFQNPGRDAWIPKVGVDFFSRQGVTGGVSYSSEQGRAAFKNDVWSANMSFRF